MGARTFYANNEMPMEPRTEAEWAEWERVRKRHHASRHHNFAITLRRTPGEWAQYPGTLSPGSGPTTVTRINNDRSGSLPCTEFEARLSETGVVMVRYWPQECRQPPPPRATRSDESFRVDYERLREEFASQRAGPMPPPLTITNWADALFDRVGPERAEVIYKLLSRVLHPDMPLGSTELQRELNEARRR